MLQKIATLKIKKIFTKRERGSFSTLLFLSLFVPTLIVTLFALVALDGTQKSQLVLIALSSLLLSMAAVRYHVSGRERATYSQIEAQRKEFEVHASQRNEEQVKKYEERVLSLEKEGNDLRREKEELHGEMEKKLQEIRLAYFEFEEMRAHTVRVEEELKRTRLEADEKLARKETLLQDYQHTIYEQRAVLEKKQQYIIKLEAKVRDLMYEMRTLLQLEEPASDPHIPFHLEDAKSVAEYYLPASQMGGLNHFDLTAQLEKYLALAEKFTGADHLSMGPSRFAEHSSYQIDLRRFFDCLQDENHLVLFFFSLQEGRFLFVNYYVTNLLGHSPEKFVYKFTEIVESGYQQWKESLSRLQEKKISRCRLLMRTKEGEKKILSCQMGVIKGGPFRGNALGILTPHQ